MDGMIANDLASMMSDPFATVAVAIGSSSTRGYLDQGDQNVQEQFGNNAQVRVTAVTIATGSLDGLVIDADITVNAIGYKVREIVVADDGKLTHIRVA